MRVQPPWRVVFLGTDHFALHFLKALHKSFNPHRSHRALVDKMAVITKSAKREVNKYASENSGDMSLYVWPDVNINPGQFDVGVVASFGQLIPKRFIELFPYGILNVHPSLLPKWRGCAPIPYTILAGQKSSGITIQQIQPKRFDVGPIVNQMNLDIPSGVNCMQLSDLMARKGADLLLETLSDLHSLEEQEVDQDDRLATYAHKIHCDDHRLIIDWPRESCRQIDRKFRAFAGLHDLRSYYGPHRVKLREPIPMTDLWMYSLKDRDKASRPGSAVYVKNLNCICIQCRDGLVGVKEIVVKKPMSAKSFYNGYMSQSRCKGSDTYFSSVPHSHLAAADSAQNKVNSKRFKEGERRKLAEQKYWQLQLLRMATSPG